MIISQTLGLEQSENHKPAYFGEPMPSPLSFTASVPNLGHSTISGSTQAVYPPTDGYYIPNRMQADLSSMNMYQTQTDTSAMNSPGNYIPNAVSVATNPGHIASHYAAAGLQHPPCYSSLGDEYEMRQSVGAVWHGSYGQPSPSCYSYENNFGHQYPYERYCGMDINDGVRRKNATRESTNTLKAWLQEHKKNPYPTKGEKIMLAIITKMTLTQVSTWFANARRRLKKENKMTWTPKNRSSDSNNNSKKTEVDEDEASQHSHDNECKSDNEQSIDSDDSDTRKVTSTNSNDEITTTSDFKEEFHSERCSVTSDPSQHHQETNDFASQPSENHLSSDFGTYDHKTKQWSTVTDNIDHKPPELLHHPNVGVNSPFSNNSYAGPSDIIGQASSIVSSSLDKTEESCSPKDINYPSQDWNTDAYYPSHTTPEDQRLPRNGTDENAERLRSKEAEFKTIKNNFSLNSTSEQGSACSIVSSSFPHLFPSQHSRFSHNIDYYRQVDRPNNELDLSYYHNTNTRMDMKTDGIVGSYPVNGGQHILSKTVENITLPASSLPSADSTAINQGHPYQQHFISQDFSNLKLIKSVASTATGYPPSFYHQDSFNQIHSSAAPGNLDYYQRKNFINSDSLNCYHHSPADSPRK